MSVPMELSFSATPTPLDAAPAAPDPAAASPAVSCSPQPQLEADAAASTPADDRFHISGMCLPVLFLDFILTMWNLVVVEVLICLIFLFYSLLQLRCCWTPRAWLTMRRCSLNLVFAQLSVSVTPVGFYELGICGQFWLVGLGIV
jgi:hypothetical protein